jgi:hypothetical protein
MKRLAAMAAVSFGLAIIGGCENGGEDADVAIGAMSADLSETDAPIALDECPLAVQETIKAHLDGGTITELERTTDHGEVLYEVDLRTDDGVVEFDVAEDGTFRGYELDDDDDDESEDDDSDDEHN